MSAPAQAIGRKKKIALVLSGGGMRAYAFHLGVAQALEEKGFRFFGGLAPADASAPRPQPGPMEISTYVGSSAGSLVAAGLATGESLEALRAFIIKHPGYPAPMKTHQIFRLRTENVAEMARGLPRHLLRLMRGELSAIIDLTFSFPGFFSMSGLASELRKRRPEHTHFHDFLPDLFIVATQLDHSRKVVFGKHRLKPPAHDLSCAYDDFAEIPDAIAASSTIPGLCAPYPIKDAGGKEHHFIDGEVRETLSTHIASDAGADLIIASHTHQPYHLSETVGSIARLGLPVIAMQTFFLLVEQKINAKIHNDRIHRRAIDAVAKFCKRHGVADDARERIIEILELELHHPRDVDTIYIHPEQEVLNHQAHHQLSLSEKTLRAGIEDGYRRATAALTGYTFADLEKTRAAG